LSANGGGWNESDEKCDCEAAHDNNLTGWVNAGEVMA
jgi:hypothetical protein